MKLGRGAWKRLVGIKYALVLIAMLLFCALLFAALNARPGMKPIKDGALVLDLKGSIVEQPAEQAPFAALSGRSGPREYRARDVLRAPDGHHALIHPARQQPQREADHARRMGAHPLDGEIGLAGVGGAQDRPDQAVAARHRANVAWRKISASGDTG